MQFPFVLLLLNLAADPEAYGQTVDRHRFFLDMDKESQTKVFAALSLGSSSTDAKDLPKNKPLDLPIFE
jgi:hypothetical protein